jgi:hypothetical protein
MVRGLGRMAGRVVASAQQNMAFVSVTILKNVVWRRHAENMFSLFTSLVKRLPTQVFRAEFGNYERLKWCFPEADPNKLRL